MDDKGASKGAKAERTQEEAADQRTTGEGVTGDERQKGQGGSAPANTSVQAALR